MPLKATYKTVASLFGAVLLAVLVVVASFGAFRQIQEASAARKQSRQVLNAANQLLADLVDAETGQRGFLLTGDEAFLEPYLRVRDGIPTRLEEFQKLPLLRQTQEQLNLLSPRIDLKMTYLARNIDLGRNHDVAGALVYLRGPQGRPLMDSIRSGLSEILRIEGLEWARHEGEFQANMRTMFALIIVISLFSLLCALAFTFFVYRGTQQQLKDMIHSETRHLLLAEEETNKQLQAANVNLQRSEENLAVTLNSIGDGVIATDAQARVTRLNPIAETMTGWQESEAIGRKIDEIFHIINQETRELATIPVMETLARGTIMGLANHTVLIARDGRECAIADSCAPIRDREGKVVGAVLVFHDVTEEYAAQQALRDSAALVQTVLNTVVDGIITFQADEGLVDTVNPAVQRMFGYSAEEIIGQDFSILIPELDGDPQKNTLSFYSPSEDARAKGLGREVTGRRKDGSRFPMEIAVTEMWLGGHRSFTAILRDNTFRKEAEEALKNAGALQNAIFNSANFSSIATDAKGVIQIFNVGAERMLGYTAAEVMNKITPADISDPLEIIERAEALSLELSTPIAPGFEALAFKAYRGIEDIYELTYIRKDGSRFPAVVSVTGLRDDQGAIIGYLLIGTDNTARKRAEEDLVKAGALQTAIFNSANFSSIATDANGVIQIFNVGAEAMLGYTAAEVLNHITPADISDPQELVVRAKALSIELNTPIAPGFEALAFKAARCIEDIYELTYIRKDGSRFPAVVSVTALRNDQGGIIGYLLIGTDNTARKQAEEALLKAGALQNAIFNSANFSSIATDANGVIQIFNVGAERMLGYTAADVINKITPADISDPQEVILRAKDLSIELTTPIAPGFEALVFKASRGIEDIYELTYIRKDGSRFPAMVSVTALRDEDEGIIGYLLIGTDNTARKQIEAEQEILAQRLRDYQFYTRSLFEANMDALMTSDPSGNITDVNKQMEQLTGRTRDELIGAPFKGCFTDPDRAETSIRLVLSERKITNYELTARALDGRETVVSYNATTFYDRDRKLQGMFAAARDVTERKALDHALQEKNLELESARIVAEKANLAKSDFLSSMSHELRSPLNAILGFAQLMETDPVPPTPGQRESIAHILKAGWHLLKLINEILDLAKIESRQIPISREPVSLAQVVVECQSMIDLQAQQRGLTLNFPTFSEPYFVEADRTRVKQVLLNLLSNAIKYNKLHGAVEVECQELEPGRIRVSVRDNGAGLNSEELAQLFQAFNRLGQETGSEEGTGIGLVVARQLVELMGGVIGVESTVGVGSVFWFELLAVDEPHYLSNELSQADLPNLRMPAGVHLQTLLYVEDNPANLNLVEQIMARHPGIRLLSAVDGSKGVALAKSTLPDVILMDINLPGIDGYEALRLLRSDPITEHIPVIAVSANAMPRDIKRGLEAGFYRYITKPIMVKEFMHALELALEYAGAKRDKSAVGVRFE